MSNQPDPIDTTLDGILLELSEASWATDMRKDLHPLQDEAKAALQLLIQREVTKARIDELERLAETLSPVVFDMNQKLFMAKARDDRIAQLSKETS